MIYISGKVRDSADIDNRICLNLLPYVINCFFKCKINYQKKITQSEYDHIKNFIEEVKSIPKITSMLKILSTYLPLEKCLKFCRFMVLGPYNGFRQSGIFSCPLKTYLPINLRNY